jgi:hypothetical protein
MSTGGPFVNAALICEKVLQERDGVLTAVRIIDRFTITAVASAAEPLDNIPLSVLNFSFLLVLKSGVFKGTAPVTIRVNSPSEQVVAQSTADVFFEGEERGVNIVSQMQFPVQEEGLYWLDVICLEQLMTRVPLRVFYQRVAQGSLRLPKT